MPVRGARSLIVVLGSVASVVALGLVLRPPPRTGLADGATTPAPDTIVYTRPPGARRGAAKEIAALAGDDRRDPRAVARSVRVARAEIEAARETGDPRFLGRAEAVIAPFVADREVSPEVLVLRATIRQSLHDFDGALADLDVVVARRPDDAQAWLTRATILTVKGEHAKADEGCGRVKPIAPALVYAVCHGTILSLTGRASDAVAAVEASLAAAPSPPAEVVWARSSVAEYKLRAGDLDGAERSFREALALSPGDPYAEAALADLLLDRGRFADVLDRLRRKEANDALLLRLALAADRAKANERDRWADELRARHAASRLRGDRVHRREEARFVLELERDPRRALELALENWTVQKEPADLRILLEAAVAARARSAAGPAIAFLERTRLEDPRILELRKALGP